MDVRHQHRHCWAQPQVQATTTAWCLVVGLGGRMGGEPGMQLSHAVRVCPLPQGRQEWSGETPTKQPFESKPSGAGV
jgi:hypothetical protein